jgi:hypothetical protein
MYSITTSHNTINKNTVLRSEKADRQAKALNSLVQFLGERYRGQHVHVWVDSKRYLGLFVWGMACHWRDGYNESMTEMSRISRQALVINLKTGIA